MPVNRFSIRFRITPGGLVVLMAIATGLWPAVVSEAADSKGFKTSLTLGATLTDGNSETMVGNASLLTEGEKDRLGSVRAGIEANYGESTVRRREDGETEREKETTVENARIFANARKTLGERTFAYLVGSVLYDDIAQIDYRAMLGPGLGVYLLKREATTLSIELGTSYIWEDVSDEREDYLAARLAQRFDYAINDRSRLWQAAEVLPKANEFDDYLLNAEAGIEAAVNSRMNLRLVLQDKYDSTPGEGLKKNDLTLIAGLSVAL